MSEITDRKVVINLPYHRPSIWSKYGQYESRTEFTPKDKNPFDKWGAVKISLVWFNHLGWYYIVDLECSETEGHVSTGKWKITNDNVSCSWGTWSKGKELSLCAETAVKAAKELCKKHQITVSKFKPFVVAKRY